MTLRSSTRIRSRWAIALGATVLLATAGCTASGLPEQDLPAVEKMTFALPEPATPLKASEADEYSGVARIQITSNCTGTLLDTGVDAGPAYLVTNGHCAGGWTSDANGVVIDGEFEGTADFHALAGALDKVDTLTVTSVPYSTMKRYDIAIAELEGTLGEAKARGLKALPFSHDGPAEGDAVVNIGAPVQNLAEDENVLRRGECTLGNQTDLIEFNWYWQDSWSNDCPGIIQGSSGSPLIADGEIVALINTTTEGGFVKGGNCYMSNPCELGESGPVTVDQRSYAVSVAGVYTCFDDTGTFALTEACPLARGGIHSTGRQAPIVSLDSVVAADPDTGAFSLLSDEPTTAIKSIVPADSSRGCLDPDNYGTASLTLLPDTSGNDDPWDVQGAEVRIELPQKEGIYFFCVADIDTPTEPAVFVVHVDDTPPVFGVNITADRTEEGVVIIPMFIIPELADFRLKDGPLGTVDCDDRSGYTNFMRIPRFIPADELPVTYCVLAADMAGNEAPIAEFTVR